MSKAILVMNMPNTCFNCKFCRQIENELEACCELVSDKEDITLCRMIDNKHRKKKPEWCPLKELPKKDNESYFPDEYLDGYANGWNACINEFLGNKAEVDI